MANDPRADLIYAILTLDSYNRGLRCQFTKCTKQPSPTHAPPSPSRPARRFSFARAGVPFRTPGSTNLLRLVTLTGDEFKGREG